MINIRPVSDLRNKYPEIEELVLKEDEAVYLTKNGTAVLDEPTLVDDLDPSTVREGSKLLYATQDVFTAPAGETPNAAVNTSYVLKMWIDESVTIDNETQKNYTAKVNVDSAVTPIQ